MNKTLWIVVVVLLAVGGYYWVKSNDAISPTVSQGTATPSVAASPVKSSGSAKATATPTPVANTNTKTYTQLVAEYKDRRVQFSASCEATPSSFVLKNNTSILLDNRANVARTITVDGRAYNLAAYGYQVVTLSSATLPRTIGLNCGSSVNVSSVLLQANISGE